MTFHFPFCTRKQIILIYCVTIKFSHASIITKDKSGWMNEQDRAKPTKMTDNFQDFIFKDE